MSHATAILLIFCKDQKGLVARVAGFIHEFGGNILDSDHHTDRETGDFLMRTLFDLAGFQIPQEEIADAFAPIAKIFNMNFQIYFSDRKPRIGILVSQYDHCLVDVLQRHRRGELAIDIPVIVSNHQTSEWWANLFYIPFRYFPVTPQTKEQQEREVLAVFREHQVELVVMARYMQIVSEKFLEEIGCPVMNIHHSFLPAFVGAKPYHQAYDRGVKIIGATAHYATPELDEGPIIEQDVVRVGHRDTVQDLIRKGRDLEVLVLARAIRLHIEHRVLVYGRKTVVFD
ncbi:MAG: formyltetrahydrofolate deformylase [Nitrospira sp.]|nr:formyltetrahydrofolate deformylase [Nitrospira sp.]MCA9457714.1 formyltetrahydrofolate deformylase [Nitrospira sp.]